MYNCLKGPTEWKKMHSFDFIFPCAFGIMVLLCYQVSVKLVSHESRLLWVLYQAQIITPPPPCLAAGTFFCVCVDRHVGFKPVLLLCFMVTHPVLICPWAIVPEVVCHNFSNINCGTMPFLKRGDFFFFPGNPSEQNLFNLNLEWTDWDFHFWEEWQPFKMFSTYERYFFTSL